MQPRGLRELVDAQSLQGTRAAGDLAPEAEPSARDRKFNALDMDLSDWLGAHEGDTPSFGAPTFFSAVSPHSPTRPGLKADSALVKSTSPERVKAGSNKRRGS